MENAKRIGIIGAGFSGVAVAYALARTTSQPLEILLIEKKQFAAGEAYATPFPYHYLNVRAEDMSAFQADANHFVDWLTAHTEWHQFLHQDLPLAQQFVPRFIYRHYLQDLLNELQRMPRIQLRCITGEVVDIQPKENSVDLFLNNQSPITVDKAVLAIGNMPPANLTTIQSDINMINAWDYEAPTHIPKDETVVILGTGLSMIDAVLTLLYQEHRGTIYAVSRRGLMPLTHTDATPTVTLANDLPSTLCALTNIIIKACRTEINKQKDWRAVITAVRSQIPILWKNSSLKDKKRFIRHVLPYWNIHRHRVHVSIAKQLQQSQIQKQLHVIAGRCIEIEKNTITLALRHTKKEMKIMTKYLINCMGPRAQMSSHPAACVQQLFARGEAKTDALDLGFDMDESGALKNTQGDVSNVLYAVGPPAKGFYWEITAVPDIRAQVFLLSKRLC